jgi:hypothetical protein
VRVTNYTDVKDLETLRNSLIAESRRNSSLLAGLSSLVSDPGQRIGEITDTLDTTAALLYGLHRTSHIEVFSSDPDKQLSSKLQEFGDGRVWFHAGTTGEFIEYSRRYKISPFSTVVVSKLSDGGELYELLNKTKQNVLDRYVILGITTFKDRSLVGKRGYASELSKWLLENTDWEVSLLITSGPGLVSISRRRPCGVGQYLLRALEFLGLIWHTDLSIHYFSHLVDKLTPEEYTNQRESMIDELCRGTLTTGKVLDRKHIERIITICERRNECT